MTEQEFLKWDWRSFELNPNIPQREWAEGANALEAAYPFIRDELVIIRRRGDAIPSDARKMVVKHFEDFTFYWNALRSTTGGNTFNNLSGQIRAWASNFFVPGESSSSQAILLNYVFIKSFDRSNDTELLERAEGAVERLKESERQGEGLLKEIQKIASEVSASTYAEIFGSEAKLHSKASNRWLKGGFVGVGTFFALVALASKFNILPTESIVEGKVVYQVSNIILRITSITLCIFLISFCFRQYSVNRHLKTINIHRQNGFNSYKLFVNSINKEDVTSRHELMLQLAKAIYEQGNTGYISDKGQNVNTGIVEITKLVQDMNKG